jgi:hypothetical protein
MGEDYQVSNLSMDRGKSLGNSEDVFGRRALHVKIGNKSSEPVPVYITDQAFGINQNFSLIAEINPSEIKFFEVTTPIDILRTAKQISVSCRREGLLKIFIDSIQVGSLRTGPACLNASLNLQEKEVVAGKKIKVEFSLESFAPKCEVEAYLNCLDQTI